VGSVCCVKQFTAGREILSRAFESRRYVPPGVEVAETTDFYAAGFDALVRRWDKCYQCCGGYVEKKCFSQVRITHILRFISIYDLLLTLPRTSDRSRPIHSTISLINRLLINLPFDVTSSDILTLSLMERSTLVLGRCLVRISAGTPTVFSEVFVVFLSLSRQMVE
jgi:hypothetical protein